MIYCCISLTLTLSAQELTPSQRVENLLEQARIIKDDDYNRALEYCNQALDILNDHPDQILLRKTHLLLADIKRMMGLYEESLQDLEQLLYGDLEFEDRESNAHAYLTAASNLERLGEYVQAYEFSLKALENFEELNNDEHIVETKIFIGNLFNVLKNYNNATKYLEEASSLAQKIGSMDGFYKAELHLGRSYQKAGYWEKSRECMRILIKNDDTSKYQKAYAYYIIGQTYLDQKNWEQALESELKSLEYAYQAHNLFVQSVVYTDLAYIEMNLGHYENSLAYNKKALALRIERGNQALVASSLRNIGTLNQKFGRYDKAIDYLMQALEISERINDPYLKSDIFHNLSKVYFEQGMSGKSYEFLLEYTILKDKMYNETVMNNIQEAQIEYLINKKEIELEILRKDSEIKELTIMRQGDLRNSIIAILIFMFIILLLLYNRYKMSKKMSVQLEIMVDERTEELKKEIKTRKSAEVELKSSLKDKEVLLKEIHHRVHNNLQVISGLLQFQRDEIETKEDAIKGFTASQDRILAMAKAYDLILVSKSMSELSLGNYIKLLTEQLKQNYDIYDKIKIKYTLDELTTGIEILDRLGLILNELIINSINHAFEGRSSGEIHIKLENKKDSIIITISDNGIGIPEDIDIIHPQTLGLSLVQMLVEQLGGTLSVSRESGTSFTLVLYVKPTGYIKDE